MAVSPKNHAQNGAPVAAGDRFVLEITDLNHDGDGVGKKEGFTCFVGGALPGERVEVRIIAVRKSLARADLLRVIDPSPDRIAPHCPYFEHCGGCSLQHLAYRGQLLWKQKYVFESLRRIGGIEAEVLPLLEMAYPWQYRNKARIHIQSRGKMDSDQHIITGFYEAGSHRIIEIGNCPIQHPLNEKMINAVRISLNKFSNSAAKESFDLSLLDAVTIRTSGAEGSCLISLEGKRIRKGISPAGLAGMEELASLIGREGGKHVAGIVWQAPGESSAESLILKGRDHLIENLGSYHYRLSPSSFFQVNRLQAEQLYKTVMSMLGNGFSRTIYDLYSGTGSLTLFLSSAAQKVIGVDSSASAIKDAVLNARLNNIGNIRFIKARAEEIGDLLMQGETPKAVCLNPPRSGSSPRLLQSVSSARPEQIIYISCNPATLARDLKLLSGKGFTVRRVQPVDMFPHTTHVETVVSMSGAKN